MAKVIRCDRCGAYELAKEPHPVGQGPMPDGKHARAVSRGQRRCQPMPRYIRLFDVEIFSDGSWSVASTHRTRVAAELACSGHRNSNWPASGHWVICSVTARKVRACLTCEGYGETVCAKAKQKAKEQRK